MKHSKIFRTLALIIILSLLLLAIPATPALAQYVTLNPTSGTVGTPVTVTGTGFTTHAYVYIFFGYSTLYPITSTPVTGGYFTRSFVVPSTAIPGFAYVVVRDGPIYTSTTLTATPFTVTARQITISPTSGYVGSTVTVSGSGFDPSSSVTIYFGTTAVYTVTATATGTFSAATFTVPESPRGIHIVKGSSASGDSPGVNFTTLQKITVTPASGAASDTVTVSGTGFVANSGITLYFDNVTVITATTTTNANGSFTSTLFTIPSASRGSHTIKAQDASSNSATTSFTIAEKITITPTSGTSDTTVTVNGTGFSALIPITIKYNAVPVTTSPAARTNVNGSFTTSFNVPAGAAGPNSVVATDGIYSASASFEAMTDATISQTTTEASPGYVGMELTLTGTGFRPNATVTITYTTELVELATPTTDASGAFSVTITIPPSVGGSHPITVTDGLTTKPFTFVMESEAPTIPAPLLPEEGIKAEAEAYLDWEDVTDDSIPVTYTLQIASDADFTTIVLEKTDLASSEYTITEGEKLESAGKKEPYYWQVKVIDGASNESQWSEARSFYTGFQWPGFIGWPLYLVIGIGGVLLLILGFWLGRRTAYY